MDYIFCSLGVIWMLEGKNNTGNQLLEMKKSLYFEEKSVTIPVAASLSIISRHQQVDINRSQVLSDFQDPGGMVTVIYTVFGPLVHCHLESNLHWLWI